MRNPAMLIPDQLERRKALDITQSFIVQAPAGSGKTELLTRRILALLAHSQKPENILAITFTRKAAAEMRQRIFNTLAKTHSDPELEQLCQQVLAQDQRMKWNLLQNPQRLQITTIDAFCLSIVQRTPLLSRCGTNIRISSSPEQLYLAAINQLFDEYFKTETPAAHPLYLLLNYLDNQLERTKELLLSMLIKRDAWLPLIMELNRQDNLRNILEENLCQINIDTFKELKKVLTSSTFLSELLALIQFASHNTDHPINTWKVNVDLPATTIDSKQTWQALTSWLLTDQDTLRKTVDKRLGFPSKDASNQADDKNLFTFQKQRMLALLEQLSRHEDIIELLKLVKHLPPISYTESEWQMVSALLSVLPLLAAHLQVVFYEANEMDFCEVAMRATQALSSDAEGDHLPYSLYQQVQHILIDEFQDTSISQMQLLKQLTNEWQLNDGHTLFLVGDPMQSIYRFRQAEVGLFLQAQKESFLPMPLIPLKLSSNFRSANTIIEWINHSFQKIFPSFADPTSGAVPYIQAQSTKTIPDASVATHTHFASEEGQAENIIELIKSIQERNPDETIAILFRQRTHIQTLIEQLQEQRIHYQGIELATLGEKTHILDILSLMKAILLPSDRLAWLSILRAPWCGLSLSSLLLLSADSKSILWENIKKTTLPEQEEQIRLKHLQAIIELSWQQLHRKPFSTLLRDAWLSLGAKLFLSEQAASECEDVFKLLSELTYHNDELSISFIEGKVKSLFAKNNSQDSHSNLQIMTIHKAKGLEFDHVIIPSLERSKVSHDSSLLIWTERVREHGCDLLLAPIKSPGNQENGIYDYLLSLEHERDLQEARRLFYVACTRAKKKLYLFSCQQKTPRRDSFLHFLTQASPLEKVLVEEPVAKDDLQHMQIAFKKIPLQDLAKTTLHLSPVANLEQPIDITWQSPDNKTLGTIIHQLFQHAVITNDLKSISQNKVINLLKQYYLPASLIPEYTHMIMNMLENIKRDSDAEWILNPYAISYAEFPLNVKIDDTIKSIRIDRVFIDNNTVWCIDYKTTQIGLTQSLEHFRQQKIVLHSQQLKAYSEALKAHFNLPVRCALYFPLIPHLIKIAEDYEL